MKEEYKRTLQEIMPDEEFLQQFAQSKRQDIIYFSTFHRIPLFLCWLYSTGPVVFCFAVASGNPGNASAGA